MSKIVRVVSNESANGAAEGFARSKALSLLNSGAKHLSQVLYLNGARIEISIRGGQAYVRIYDDKFEWIGWPEITPLARLSIRLGKQIQTITTKKEQTYPFESIVIGGNFLEGTWNGRAVSTLVVYDGDGYGYLVYEITSKAITLLIYMSPLSILGGFFKLNGGFYKNNTDQGLYLVSTYNSGTTGAPFEEYFITYSGQNPAVGEITKIDLPSRSVIFPGTTVTVPRAPTIANISVFTETRPLVMLFQNQAVSSFSEMQSPPKALIYRQDGSYSIVPLDEITPAQAVQFTVRGGTYTGGNVYAFHTENSNVSRRISFIDADTGTLAVSPNIPQSLIYSSTVPLSLGVVFVYSFIGNSYISYVVTRSSVTEYQINGIPYVDLVSKVAIFKCVKFADPNIEGDYALLIAYERRNAYTGGLPRIPQVIYEGRLYLDNPVVEFKEVKTYTEYQTFISIERLGSANDLDWAEQLDRLGS